MIDIFFTVKSTVNDFENKGMGINNYATPLLILHFRCFNTINFTDMSASHNCVWYWVAPVWGQGIPLYSYYWYRTIDIAAVGTTLTSKAISYNKYPPSIIK